MPQMSFELFVALRYLFSRRKQTFIYIISLMGYFSDVQASLEGNVLVFTVVEKPRIDNIIVEGSDKVSKDDVLAAMGTKSGSVLNEQVLSDDLQKITELYHKEGFYLAKVSYRLEDRQGGRGAVLVINIKEGNKLYIKEVKIDGLEKLNRGDIDKYMALKPRGIFSWLTGTGVLKDEYLERDTNAIAAFGLNEGYVDIQVSAPTVEYHDDGIYITFNVHGPATWPDAAHGVYRRGARRARPRHKTQWGSGTRRVA